MTVCVCACLPLPVHSFSFCAFSFFHTLEHILRFFFSFFLLLILVRALYKNTKKKKDLLLKCWWCCAFFPFASFFDVTTFDSRHSYFAHRFESFILYNKIYASYANTLPLSSGATLKWWLMCYACDYFLILPFLIFTSFPFRCRLALFSIALHTEYELILALSNASQSNSQDILVSYRCYLCMLVYSHVYSTAFVTIIINVLLLLLIYFEISAENIYKTKTRALNMCEKQAYHHQMTFDVMLWRYIAYISYCMCFQLLFCLSTRKKKRRTPPARKN